MRDKLPARLKKQREKLGLTQEDVASHLGITAAALSNYERGIRDLDTELLAKLAELYGVSTDYLLGRTDDPHTHLRSVEDAVAVSDQATIEKRNEKDEVTERRVVPTEAAHREDDYEDELPEEARRALEEYKEFLRQKYRKK